MGKASGPGQARQVLSAVVDELGLPWVESAGRVQDRGTGTAQESQVICLCCHSCESRNPGDRSPWIPPSRPHRSRPFGDQAAPPEWIPACEAV